MLLWPHKDYIQADDFKKVFLIATAHLIRYEPWRTVIPAPNLCPLSAINAYQTFLTLEFQWSLFIEKVTSRIKSLHGVQIGNGGWRVYPFSATMCYVSTNFDMRRIELEALLMVCGAIDLPERRRPGEVRGRDDNGSDEEEDDDAYPRMRSAATATNARAPKNVRGAAKKADDSDSDFEFDM